MSDAALEHAHGAHPPAEEDIVPSGRIVWTGIASLVVFILGSVVAGMAMVSIRHSVNPDGLPAIPAEAGQAKIGMVEQRLFEHANQGAAWRAEAMAQLNSTGWVDRQRGIVHIPIDQAMEMVEKGARP
jgi:hypothetical protein